MRRLIAASMAAIAGAACVSERQLERVPAATLLPWLTAGETPRSEVEQRLGAPSRSFEGDRILVWRLPAEGQQTEWRAPWAKPEDAWAKEYPETSIVVVFDAQQRAERVSAVRL